MTIDYDVLISHAFPDVEQVYTERDVVLYALGLGVGGDATDPEHLRFTFEEAQGFAALPTMSAVMAGPGFWAREPWAGLSWQKILHGEQRLTLHNLMPTSGTAIGRTRISDVVDKGAGRGALIYVEKQTWDKASGLHISTAVSTVVAREDGGFGGPAGPVPSLPSVPDRAPDFVDTCPTLPQAALIYRLSGDPNPLHADPSVAANAGFRAPILHGLCSYGIAGWSILRCCCGGDPGKLRQFDLRFSSPVYPGETLQTEIWQEGDVVRFRTRVAERGLIVLNNGTAVISPT